MKYFNKIIIFAAMALILSCSDDNGVDNGGDDHAGMNFEAKIDGNAWKADSLISSTNSGQITTELKISGYGGGQAIELFLTLKKPETLDTGTYDLQRNPWTYISYQHGGVTDTTQDGYIKIDSIINNMPPDYHGSFECTITDDTGQTLYEITDGKFDTNQ